jgi:hypothetical protein
MKKLGIVLLVVGLVITLFTGFNLITKKEVLDVGDLQVSVNDNHRMEWSPLVGVGVMIVGSGVYFMGRKK